MALVLVYTTDFGWAFIILLGIDYCWRTPEASGSEINDAKNKRHLELLATAAVLVAGYAPRWPALIRELHVGLSFPHSARFFFLNAAYHFYVLFVSQSVAPWFWRFSIPAALGVAALLTLVLSGTRGEARRFLI